MTAVPRPITKLTDEQRELLAAAVRAANEKHSLQRQTEASEEAAWQLLLEARRGGVPDELLCDETRFSRATLNRKFGPRREAEDAE